MKAKDIFESLRQTTLEVSSPLICLASTRLRMIQKLVKYIESNPESAAQYEMLQEYNEFVQKDKELVDFAQGRAAEHLIK